MTESCQVLLVVHDSWMQPVPEDSEWADMRTLEQVDRLVREMGADGLVAPRVIAIGDLSTDPAVDRERALFLVYDESGAAEMIAGVLALPVDSVARRTFPLAARRRRDVIAALEQYGGPGCIESYCLFVWQTESPQDDPGYGVFGRKDVGRIIGASWESPALWESEHYAMLSHNEYTTLPRLLAAYLAAFCTSNISGQIEY